ncbi:RHS repeat-associated core domain-containing protein [Ramlibacter albus]|uniref:RHS repeat protein n=1 Tax=Ramlibacter albus TaxID=2079448 RepID=A0A923MAS0_9BURK|nr:RHS repeat-associated core domain-containing protein [Ramlibacter albus]MBC5765647.1 hypothetical protein [Ramlibacter albus]
MPTMLLARIRAFMSSTAPALLAAAFFFFPSLPAHAGGQVQVLSRCTASWWAASQRWTASCVKEDACIKYRGTRTFQGIYTAMSGNQYCQYTDGTMNTVSGLYAEPGDFSCPANATLGFTAWGSFPTCFCDDPYFTTDGVGCTTPTPRTVASNGGRTINVGEGPVVFTATVMQGTPKAGVMVLLYPHTGNFGGFTFESTPYTDANGQVRIKYSSTWDLVGATREALVSIACEGCTNRAVVKMTVLGRPALQAQMCHRTEFPIELTSGTKLLEEADLQDAALHPLEFTRHYASRWDELPAAGLGTHWSHNHAHRVALGTEWRTVLFGDGTSSRFRNAAVPAGAGANWSCPSGVDCPPPAVATSGPATWQADGNADSMTDEGDRIVVRRLHDETVYEFEKATGRLLVMRGSNGWAYTYGYAGGQLARVSNAFGRSMTFDWDAAGRLVRVVGADGNSVSFGFDSAARLVQATHSMGTGRAYLYEDTRWPNAVTGLVDERGQRWGNYAYDASGRAAVSELAGGAHRRSVAYSEQSTAVSDALGTTRNYQYSRMTGAASGLALTQSSTLGVAGESVAQRTLDANSLVVSETDFLGITTLFTWDGTRRLQTAQTRAANRPEAQTTQTDWHPTLRRPVRVTEPGRITESTWDALGNLLTRTVTDTATGEVRTWRWTYAANNLPTSMTDSEGATWQYAYDSVGNRIREKDPLGLETVYTHDAGGRVLTQTDPSGLVTRYTYDGRGRLLTQVRGSEASSYTYTPTGQLASATLPNGYQVQYTYDAAQRLVGASDSQGGVIAYTLDGEGNAVRQDVKDAAGNIALTTSRVINALNQVAAVQGAAGQNTQLSYDANGERVAQTDPLNQTTRQSLDALRRITATTFADNESASQAWNALDQLTEVTDPKNVKTSYAVNAFGEVMRESSPDIGTVTLKRDRRGDVVESRDAKGQVTQIERDVLGRPVVIRYHAGSTVRITYDIAGFISKIEDSSGRTLYTRDLHGRVLDKTTFTNDNPSNPSSYRVAYSYTNGDLTGMVYPSGLKVVFKRTAGRITGIDVLEPGKNKTWVALVSNLKHTPLGQPKSWDWFNGAKANRTFDQDGRMTSNEFARYTYDAAARMVGITQDLWASRSVVVGTTTVSELYTVPITWTAGYDKRNRLTTFERAGAKSVYTYDANSNRLTAIETQGSDVDLEGTFDAPNLAQSSNQALKIDPASNRLLGFTQTLTKTQNGQAVSTTNATVNFSVDENGAMTSDGLRKFVYDDMNRLSRVEIVKDGEAAAVRYLHNALGQRVFKSEPEVAQTLPNESELGNAFVNWLRKNFDWLFAKGSAATASLGQAFVYGDGQMPEWALLGHYGNGSATGKGNAEYIWIPTGNGTAVPVAVYSNGKLYAIHSDHLGTPRVVTDNSKQVAWQWPYSAFGSNKPSGPLVSVTAGTATRLAATRPSTALSLLLPGQTPDAESGLNENFWRTYCPSCGRYIQPDSTGLRAGLNRYDYALQNGLNYTDPEGKAVPIAVACLANPLCSAAALAASVAVLKACSDVANDVIRDWATRDEAKEEPKKDVTKRPSRVRKGTEQANWDEAEDGADGNKVCSTCDREVTSKPGEKGKDWDNDHIPPWRDRDLGGKDRKGVLDEYNRGTRLRCIQCNRSDNGR